MRRVRMILIMILAILTLGSGLPATGLTASDVNAGKLMLASNSSETSAHVTKEKKLTRDVKHAKIGGVCAGFANYFGLDVSLVRIAWALFVLLGGAGIVAYIICWIIIPPA